MMTNNPLFRPPGEADSLILQVEQGCPYNRCAFCGMYKAVRFRRLSLDEIRERLQVGRAAWPEARRVFLADGDVMSRPFAELEALLLMLGEWLPGLARVGLYATGHSIRDKSVDELRRLRALKLQTLYMGLESGDDEILARMHKAETAEEMVEAGCRAQEAGLRMSVMALLGLGGQAGTREHADRTAAALNRMQPRLLSALRVIPISGTELGEELRAGRFVPVTEYGAAEELLRLVQGLELNNTVFRANHVSNVVPLEGRLPRDKARLLAELSRQMAGGRLDRGSPGPAPMWL